VPAIREAGPAGVKLHTGLGVLHGAPGRGGTLGPCGGAKRVERSAEGMVKELLLQEEQEWSLLCLGCGAKDAARLYRTTTRVGIQG
jgi:hypothetical protein